MSGSHEHKEIFPFFDTKEDYEDSIQFFTVKQGRQWQVTDNVVHQFKEY